MDLIANVGIVTIYYTLLHHSHSNIFNMRYNTWNKQGTESAQFCYNVYCKFLNLNHVHLASRQYGQGDITDAVYVLRRVATARDEDEPPDCSPGPQLAACRAGPARQPAQQIRMLWPSHSTIVLNSKLLFSQNYL